MDELEATIWKFLIAVLGAGLFPTIWLAMLLGGGGGAVDVAPTKPTCQYETEGSASNQPDDVSVPPGRLWCD